MCSSDLLVNCHDENDWFKNDNNDLSDFWIGKTLVLNNNNILNNIYNRFNKLFTSKLDITGLHSINRHKKDESMGNHYDQWLENIDYEIEYGMVLYYNDNYSGGELVYPDLNLIIKPKERSLVIHGGKILHGTATVNDNSYRYFSTVFVKGNKSNPVILNSEIFKEI